MPLTDMADERAIALRHMIEFGGYIEIDTNEGWNSVCAILFLLKMEKEGLCAHSRVDQRIAGFSITDLGMSFVGWEAKLH